MANNELLFFNADNQYMKKIFLIFTILVCTVCNSFALQLYKTNAIASFYGKDFHGKQTSNGEKFDMYAFTCAHKLLPFDTILKVTNLSNGKSVKVRVNDRGPFVIGREIDLSTAAAEKLDMINAGTVKVKLEIVELGPTTNLSIQTSTAAKKIMAKKGETLVDPLAKKTNSTSTSSEKQSSTAKTKDQNEGQLYMIQVGAFSTKENASDRAKQLSKAGFKNIFLQKTGKIIRVTIKNIPESDLAKTEKKLNSKGFTEYTVKKMN